MGNSSYTKAASLKLDDLARPDDNTDLDASTTKHGLLLKRDGDAEHFLNGDGSWVHAPGTSYDWSYFRRVGDDAWYSSPQSGQVTNFGSLSINHLYVIPFLVPKTITLDRIAIYINTPQALSHAELGIYNNGDNLYPGSLLLDAGAVDTSAAGLKSVVINQQLVAGNLYWLAYLAEIANIALWQLHMNYMLPILGLDLSSGLSQASFGWVTHQAYGALPDPYTVGGTLLGGSTSYPPAIFVRLSAA